MSVSVRKKLFSVYFIKNKLIYICFYILSQSLYSQQSLADQVTEIRLGILTAGKPLPVNTIWRPFGDYMGQQLGSSVEIVVISNFEEMLKAINEKSIDFFYINSHVFYRLKQKEKAVAVAQMKNTLGKITSQSEFIVRRDSSIETVVVLNCTQI
jgi:ABC-type phosphate/phosphonate transport system substrate-binding protein